MLGTVPSSIRGGPFEVYVTNYRLVAVRHWVGVQGSTMTPHTAHILTHALYAKWFCASFASKEKPRSVLLVPRAGLASLER